MDKILDTIVTPYIDAQTLLAHLQDYTNPRGHIARLVKKGVLIRLKNGFYLIASRFRRGQEYPYEQVANLLFGPSYVSLEWALSFYNFIPERVVVVTSVTTQRNKDFSTPISRFTYRHLSLSRYSVGITRKKVDDQLGGFLIATPEKALIDWIFFSSRNLDENELLEDLIEAKRMEKERLKSLDMNIIHLITKQYRSETVENLARALSKL